MHRRFRKVFCALKEHSSVSYAKIATVGGFCDIDHIIVKSTAPDDLPLSEKYAHELLNIFAISPSSFHTFSISFTRRFGKTHCWKVALKCLLLLHRLLRSLPENSPFRTELLWTRSHGFLCLYPCKFRDESSSTPEDYTLFIRRYAHLLDEALDCVSLESKAIENQEEEEEEVNLQDKMKKVGTLLEVLPQLQSLIDRVMDCRPTVFAAKSFIVQSAMKHIIRDSFICYTTFRKEIVLVLDNMLQMPYRSSTSAFGIYKKAALQANQLCEFYEWCKAKGLCGSYEYPFIDRIPQIQIRALEAFLNGMWQLTDQSATSTTSSPSSSSCVEDDGENKPAVGRDVAVSTQWVKLEADTSRKIEEEDDVMIPLICFEDDSNGSSPSSLCVQDDGDNKRVVGRDVAVSTQLVKLEANTSRKIEDEDNVMAPLICFEDDKNDNWEALLDASVHLHRDNLLISCPGVNAYGHGNRLYGISSYSGLQGYGASLEDKHPEEKNQWKMAVYNPHIGNVFNPFSQPWNGSMPRCIGLSATHPVDQWAQ